MKTVFALLIVLGASLAGAVTVHRSFRNGYPASWRVGLRICDTHGIIYPSRQIGGGRDEFGVGVTGRQE